MAEIELIKISELPATSTIGDADELAVVQGGATKKVPYSVLKDGAEVTPDTTLSEAGVPADAAAVGAALAQKANQAAVTQALAAKADKTEVAGISDDIAELASVVERKADQTALNQKADKTTTDALRQDLTTLNGIVNQKADKTELNAQIGNVTAELATKANTADVNNLLAAKANVASPVFTGRPQAPTAPKGTATLQLATTAFVQNAIDDKEDKLTFDQAPTQGSTNPVTSGGVYTAVESAKADAEEAATEAKNIALGAYATPTASGSLLTLTDGADGIPAKKLTLSLSPHQSGSGDPSPENVRPISGYESVKLYRTGKNMLDPSLCVERTQGGVTRKVNADGTITLTGTPTLSSIFWKSTDDMNIPIKAGTYATETFNSKCVLRLAFRKAATQTSNVFTLTEDDEILNVRFLMTGTGVELNDVFSPMLVSGGTIPTDFEPYQGDTYTIAIPSEAGTVYGGMLTVEQDGSGTLTVDRAIKDASDGEFNMLGSTKPNIALGVSPTFPNIKIPATNNDITNAVSNKYKAAAYTGTNGIYNYAGTDALFTITTTGRVAVYDSTQDFSAMTTDEIRAYLTGTKFCYPLATPQTYTLTAEQVTTLLGDNTVWMDADGSIDLTYRADTEKYVERRIAEVQALVLENNG